MHLGLQSRLHLLLLSQHTARGRSQVRLRVMRRIRVLCVLGQLMQQGAIEQNVTARLGRIIIIINALQGP